MRDAAAPLPKNPTSNTEDFRLRAGSPAAGPHPAANADFLDSWRSSKADAATEKNARAGLDGESAALERRRSRRRFTASLAIGFLAFATAGAWHIGRSANTRAAIADKEMLESERIDNAFLDRLYLSDPTAGVQSYLQAAPAFQVATVTKWIAMRGHTPLYGTLVGLLANPVLEVRVRALTDLKTLPPFDLKPQLPTLNTIAAFEPDSALKEKILRLIKSIENA